MATSDGSISYNSQQLYNLAGTLGTDVKTIEDNIDDLISEAKNLYDSGKWSGEMYDAFMTNVNNYKKDNIDPLLKVMHDYVGQINNAAEETERTTAAGVARFN